MSNNETKDLWPPSKIMMIVGAWMLVFSAVPFALSHWFMFAGKVASYVGTIGVLGVLVGWAWGAWRWERWSETVISEAPKLDELRERAQQEFLRRS